MTWVTHGFDKNMSYLDMATDQGVARYGRNGFREMPVLEEILPREDPTPQSHADANSQSHPCTDTESNEVAYEVSDKIANEVAYEADKWKHFSRDVVNDECS